MAGKPGLGAYPAADRRGRERLRKTQGWEQHDLVRRLSGVLDFAAQALHVLSEDGWPQTNDTFTSSAGVAREKLVAETAMLLHCAASVQHLSDELRARVGRLLLLVAPLARTESLLAGLCADPARAYSGAVAHIVVTRLGYPDALIDRLLTESNALDSRVGPERLPLSVLEQEWLATLWSGSPPRHRQQDVIRRSILGRPLDVIGATRLDVYSFTHAVIYATDFGARRIRLPRARAAIAADADAALALGLDIDDLDVAAELAMTWPMLAMPWSPIAAFAFDIIAETHDDLGFLPGPAFDASNYSALTGDEQDRYRCSTSYHTTYVMGMLCAASLRDGCAPPAELAPGGSPGAGSALLALIEPTAGQPRWRAALQRLGTAQQDAVAPLIVTMLLRRCKDRGDISGLRTCLKAALDFGLVEAPVVRQAVAFLRRSTLLSEIVQQRSGTAEAGAGL